MEILSAEMRLGSGVSTQAHDIVRMEVKGSAQSSALYTKFRLASSEAPTIIPADKMNFR